MSHHKISRQLKISRRCRRQIIRKFDRCGTVATRPDAGRPKEITNRQSRLIKLEQIRDETNSLTDLVRYANINVNLSISTSTICRILRQYNMTSYIASRKPRITLKPRRARIDWCNEHLSWSIPDWSKVIFSDESNYEVLNRKNRIYFRRFRTDRTRSKRSQKRTHWGGGLGVWSLITCRDPDSLIVFDGHLNSLNYIDLLEEHLPTALKRFPNNQLNDISYQHDNARLYVSKMTQGFFKKNNIKQLKWPANSPELNIIENVWSILDDKLLKLSINNLGDFKNSIEKAWSEISTDTIEKLFQSMPKRVRQWCISMAFHVTNSVFSKIVFELFLNKFRRWGGGGKVYNYANGFFSFSCPLCFNGRWNSWTTTCMCTTHHCALEAHKWSIHERFLEIRDDFFVRTKRGSIILATPVICQPNFASW